MSIKITGGVKVPQGKFKVYTPPVPAGPQLWSWGRGSFGLVGDGTAISKSSPVQIGSLLDWASINAGYLHSHAIKTDGSLWSWGRNNNGQLGVENTTNYSSPVQVGGLTDWSSVSGGRFHSQAIKTDGTLWSIGQAITHGQLGDGTNINKSSPVQVGALTDWSSVSAGRYHSLAIKTNGSLWAWGRNTNGYLGDGTVISKSSPVQIGALTDWASVSVNAGIHSLAIKTDGTLWSWGYNFQGQLGDGTTINKSSPVQVGALTDWSNISAGNNQHSLAIKTDSTLWSWGDNSSGKLAIGLSDANDRSSPVQVGSLTDWANVSAGKDHSLARKTNGTLWSWGDNSPHGQLGDGTVVNKNSPIQVGSDTNWTSINAGGNHSIAIKTV